jgi:hypothetical protein
MLASFERIFQVWRYTTSHNQLLLRSNRARGATTRIDVLFKNVHVMKLPTHLEGLDVWEASEGDAKAIVNESGFAIGETDHVYILGGSNYRGYVIAGSIAMHEDEGEYDDPSPLLQ